MVIVAGHITVDPEQRESYLAGSVRVVEKARGAAGCLDFAIAADLIDPGRVNMFALGVASGRPSLPQKRSPQQARRGNALGVGRRVRHRRRAVFSANRPRGWGWAEGGTATRLARYEPRGPWDRAEAVGSSPSN
jgi:hypothetical protein